MTESAVFTTLKSQSSKTFNRIQPMGTMKGCTKRQGYPIVHISVWTEVVDQATKSEIQNRPQKYLTNIASTEITSGNTSTHKTSCAQKKDTHTLLHEKINKYKQTLKMNKSTTERLA